MQDGSDPSPTADLNALLNHRGRRQLGLPAPGGGVGIGLLDPRGHVVVADGTEAGARLERVLTADREPG